MARKYQGISEATGTGAPAGTAAGVAPRAGATAASGRASSGYTLLVIDDSPEIVESTRRLMEAEGHRVLTAESGPAGLAVLDQERVQLIICDYFMPAMTGEEVVRRVRERDRLVQIILQTGYAGEKPARVMMRDLDIQGYHDKGEGAERLLLWVDGALKAYRHMLAMEKHRMGLRFILDITPELHRIQPLDELLKGLLWQIEGLLGAENSFLATFHAGSAPVDEHESEGFVALVEGPELQEGFQVRFGTGRFNGGIQIRSLPEDERQAILTALQTGEVKMCEAASVVPLMLGKKPVGLIYLDRHAGYARDRELLEIYAAQAAAAIQNSLLYDMATTDSLTGVYVRGFAVQQLHQAIKRSMRRGDPLSLLMIDLDKFKQINDSYGHQLGDRALRAVGELLREGIRETDVVGRYGGDEFMVVLPDTPAAGALIVADRLLHRARSLTVEEAGQVVPVHLSVGIATLDATEEERDLAVEQDAMNAATESLIACADRALYAAKGSDQAGTVPPLLWKAILEPLVAEP
jgi:two-component system, cell cycle response regulator